jgi:hypothetical protein
VTYQCESAAFGRRSSVRILRYACEPRPRNCPHDRILAHAPGAAHSRRARSRRLYLFGALVDTHPVTQALAVACIVAWRLYRGSTPVEEFRRFLNGKAPYASAGLRPNNRWRGP